MSGVNGYWKRHPNKEIQRFLIELHLQGWRIQDPPKYYKALCGCPEKHRTTIHITPSGGYYLNNKRQHLRNMTCFGESERGSNASHSDETDV
ncbi:MAG: hypothetical protein RLZZ249_55 [Actinomycetota bacterium]|jgi:hypothetical protein